MISSQNAYVTPVGSERMATSANTLTKPMQGMKIGAPASTNYNILNNQHLSRSQFNSAPIQSNVNTLASHSPGVPSPQNRVHGSTSVTYSGSPRATYPYNSMPQSQKFPGSNSSILPKISPNSMAFDPKVTLNQCSSNSENIMSNNMSHDMKIRNENFDQLHFQPPGSINLNSISNGSDAEKLHKDQSSFPQVQPTQNKVLESLHQPPFPYMSPSMTNQQYKSSVLNSQSVHVHHGPPLHSPSSQLPSTQNQMYNEMQVLPSTVATPMGFSSSSSYPPGSPPHSGILPTTPLQYPGIHAGSPQPSTNAPYSPGSLWPNQQYPGANQSTGNFPYPSQNQGMPQQQPSQKLDLDQMPSVVQIREEDRKLRGGIFLTDVRGQLPPLVTTDFTVQDRGICSPRYIRSSLYCLPNQPDMLKQTGLPFALTIIPMANLEEAEKSPPLCLFRDQGPLRCKRCKAYVCPFMSFMEGGRCFQCAFCKVVTEVPQDYFCFLDGMGERTDKYHRPELCLGSYEYIATKEYCRNDQMPNPPAYIFMMEVSHATFRNGLVPLLCENMKNILHCLQNDEENDTSKLRIGFVTYNSVLHFYNMKKNLTQPHIMILSDVHNAFVPLLEGFLVTLEEAEALVDCLMDHIPRLFMNETATEVILGPVVQVGLEALKNANCSGKLLIFHSTIPNADAPGKLPHREGQKLLGTDKQKMILNPQHDFYGKLAQECVAAGCAVDLFLFPNSYIDIASINPLCRQTGGQIYKYTYFQSHTDGDRFLEDLERNITNPTAFDAVLRVRTSAGISPVFYYGNFYMSNTTDIELSVIDCHKSVTIELAYDDKLPENEIVYIQAALLYTTITGERKIRVHNIALTTSVGMPDIFRCCEMDTIINFLAKQALKQLLEHSPQQIKSNLVNRSVKILSCYRKHCASNSVSGQLILPDSLKLLPLFINCLLKSDAIAGGSDMSLDDRSFAILAVNSMDVKSTATYFYPTLIPLHDVSPDNDVIPNPIRCSIEKLDDNGAYLLENGIYMFLWIGQAVSCNWLQNVFGVPTLNQVDKQKTSLPELNTPLSQKIRNIIEDIEEGRQWYMRLTVMVQGDKLEVVFRQFLVEDRGTDGKASYVDFLCHLYREISKNV